jgi:hypothetical protein
VLAEIIADSEVPEAVEDEIEAELVLLAVVVAGAGVRAHWSVGRGAGTPSRELQQKGLRELGGLFGGAKRETPFLQGKSIDVAVEGCERVDFGIGFSTSVHGPVADGQQAASPRSPRAHQHRGIVGLKPGAGALVVVYGDEINQSPTSMTP